jgi:hypothetical protein
VNQLPPTEQVESLNRVSAKADFTTSNVSDPVIAEKLLELDK